MSWLLLATVLLLTAFAQVCFKHGVYSGSRKWTVLGLGLFAATPPVTYLTLKGLEVGLVYMSTAVAQVLVLFMSWALLKERITRHHSVAIAFIAAGMVLYGFG